MKSIRCAHILVVADSDHALLMVAQLRRMEVARVTSVAGVEEARQLCQAGDTDACIVEFDDSVPDARPMAATDAPGRRCGVPSLMLVHTVTPHLRAAARRQGYLAAMPAAIPPRMLYRRIGAALQQRRAARRGRRAPMGIGTPFLELARPALLGKPTLH